MAIIIVVDMQMDLGDGGGGTGHEQEYNVSEPHYARCVAVECVCVWLVLGNWIVSLCVVVRASVSV